MGIKKVLNEHGVNYAKHTIVQSLDLKEKFESCKLKRDEVMLMLLDIVDMYPSVRVNLIQKALQHHARNLPDYAKEIIDLCMDIVQFGMKSTLIQFRGWYFVYKGTSKDEDLSDEDVLLTIGAYESAFLADIVASYVFEKIKECFIESLYRGIYRDDELVAFVGERTKCYIQRWLGKYQSLVNELAGGNYLHFTTELWLPPPANKINSPIKKDKKEKGVT
eukprot:134325-Ditylum_brightwellii.AAC.1